MTNNLELTVTKTIPASREAVFRAWLDPKAMSQFMTPAEGMECPKVEADPKVGGKYLVMMKAGDQELPHRGEYKTINEFDEIAFTWESDYTIPGSLVTIKLEELGPKETQLTLHHVGFPNEESRDNHNGGWGRIADCLAHFLAK